MVKKIIIGIFFTFVFIILLALVIGSVSYIWQRLSSEEIAGPADETEKTLVYIKDVYESAGEIFLDVDFVEWLEGEEAIEAMKEDGECPQDVYPDPSYCIPNGYYIRNQDSTVETLRVSKNAEFTVHTYASGECHVEWEEKISYETFKSFWKEDPPCLHLKEMPYNIESRNEAVVKISEQYIP